MWQYPVLVVVADEEDRLCDRRFLTGEIVGHYMSEWPTITLGQEDKLGRWSPEIVLAHELIHAVQDYRGIELGSEWAEYSALLWESSVAHELYPEMHMLARQLYETGEPAHVDLCQIGILDIEPFMEAISARYEEERWARHEGL